MEKHCIIGYGDPLDVLHNLALVAIAREGCRSFPHLGFGQSPQLAFCARLTARPHLCPLRPSVTLTLAAAGGTVNFVGEGIAAALPCVDSGNLFYAPVDEMEVDSITMNDNLGHLASEFSGIEIILLHDGSDRSNKLLLLDWTAVTSSAAFPLPCVTSPPFVLPGGSSAEAASAAPAFHHAGKRHQHRIPIARLRGSPFPYLLRLIEIILAHERLEHAIHQIHGQLTFIPLADMPLADVVFLQCHCSSVGDVGENILYCGLLDWSPLPSHDSVSRECLCDEIGRFSCKVSTENLLDDLALGRNNAEHLSVPSVAVRCFIPVRNPLGESSPHAPPNVVADTPALFLCKRCEQRQEEFPLHAYFDTLTFFL